MTSEVTVRTRSDRASIRAESPGPRWHKVLNHRALQSAVTPLAFLGLLAGYSLWLGDRFSSVDARLLDVHQNAPILVLGLSVIVTLVAGQFDLSVASMATLTTFLSVGLTVRNGWPFWLVIAACLVTGVVGGLVNGILVARLHVNTFIATLGTGGILLGLSNVYSRGTQITPGAENPGQLPTWFSGLHSLGAYGTKFPTRALVVIVVVAAFAAWWSLREHRPARSSRAAWDALTASMVALVGAASIFVFDLPAWLTATSWTIAIVLALTVIVWLVLGWTTFGRNLAAGGANSVAARLAGINVDRGTVAAFALGGLLAAFAGLLLAANQGSAAPGVGSSFLLPAFAAAFLSTVMFSSGRYSAWGTVIGGTCIVWVAQGLIVGGVHFTWTQVVNGLVLVLAVALSTTLRRHKS